MIKIRLLRHEYELDYLILKEKSNHPHRNPELDLSISHARFNFKSKYITGKHNSQSVIIFFSSIVFVNDIYYIYQSNISYKGRHIIIDKTQCV